MKCGYCGDPAAKSTNEQCKHMMVCPETDETTKALAEGLLRSRLASRALPIRCCKMRKKIKLTGRYLDEEETGIPDSELADVSTFQKVGGKPEVEFNFCPWCGKPWRME